MISSSMLKIEGATLLSIDEYKKAKPYVPKLDKRWWLRSPSSNSDIAAVVHSGGSVSDYGSYVRSEYEAVRPALQISNPESLNLNPGDKIEAAGLSWTVIPGGMALCDSSISHHMFDRHHNDYEKSNIKDFVETWAMEKGINISKPKETVLPSVEKSVTDKPSAEEIKSSVRQKLEAFKNKHDNERGHFTLIPKEFRYNGEGKSFKDKVLNHIGALLYLQEIITDKPISRNIDGIINCLSNIENMHLSPLSYETSAWKSVMDTELPRAEDMLSRYDYYENIRNQTSSDRYDAILDRINSTIQTYVPTLESRIDGLYETLLIEVNAEINVFESMLKADGLTGEDLIHESVFGRNNFTKHNPDDGITESDVSDGHDEI